MGTPIYAIGIQKKEGYDFERAKVRNKMQKTIKMGEKDAFCARNDYQSQQSITYRHGQHDDIERKVIEDGHAGQDVYHGTLESQHQVESFHPLSALTTLKEYPVDKAVE